jgi:cobalt-zinc-cadmium efflux system membrane fusion protein
LLSRNAVAGKDVVDAETDYQQAEATVRETEGKLRQTGFDPRLLAKLRIGVVLAVADVPEAKVRSVTPGEAALFEFSAYPGEVIRGTVATVGETVDPATRSVRVAIEVPDAKGRIKPGMFARVNITERTERSLVMPLSAVVSADAKNFAFVKVAPRTFERRAVVLDLDDGRNVKVRSGVQAGDSVATTNAILLKGLSFGY